MQKEIIEIFKSIFTLFCCGVGILFVVSLGFFGKRGILKSAQKRREKIFSYFFKKDIDDSWDQKK